VLGCRARGCTGAGCPRGAVAGAAAGKQPAGGGVGGGLRVLPLACCSQQQAGEGLGHWGGWLSEPSLYCPVIVFGDVVDAQPDDAAGRLGVEQHQTAGHAGTQRWFVVGEDPTQQRQASALGGVGEVVVALVEPVQEVLGVGELLASEPSGGCGERAGAGSRAQPWELAPAAELCQQPMVRVVDVALASLRVGVSQYDHRRWQPR
jgi:hypothetical protein